MLFLRQFLGKLLIGLGIYAFIIISGVYSIDIFLNDVLIQSLDALIASLITFGLIVLGKFIYPKLTSSKSSQDTDVKNQLLRRLFSSTSIVFEKSSYWYVGSGSFFFLI